jgi:A118 family predicted phage portal protein
VADRNGNPFFNVYSPEIRDQSFFNGFNNILKRVEFNSNLAYGTLSDPANVDKTAEEIKASKQRSYSTVKDIQRSLDTAMVNLVSAMDTWATLDRLAPEGEIDMSISWDDSLVVDKEKDLTSMQQDVAMGVIRKEIYVAKKYGVTEEEAKKMMPSMEMQFPEEE